MTAPEVKVTQAAKEAAAAYHGKVGSPPPAISFIRGKHSDQDSLVQAFARFEAEVRTTHTAEADALLAMAVGALERIADTKQDCPVHNRVPDESPKLTAEQANRTASTTLAAIRAKTGE
jgi:hypothetical protein